MQFHVDEQEVRLYLVDQLLDLGVLQRCFPNLEAYVGVVGRFESSEKFLIASEMREAESQLETRLRLQSRCDANATS